MRGGTTMLLLILVCAAASAGDDAAFAPGLVARYTDGRNEVVSIVPRPSFVLGGGESLHPTLAPLFSAEWTGFLKIIERGTYTLSSIGGEAKVFVDGAEAGGRPLELAPGQHGLKIEFARKPGPARLQLVWESDKFRPEPVPSSALSHRDAPPELSRHASIERGRDLFENLNCAGCHNPAKSEAPPRHGPDLSEIGSRAALSWIYRWLENPKHFRAQTLMPALNLSEPERRDIAAYLFGLKNTRADPKEKIDRKLKPVLERVYSGGGESFKSEDLSKGAERFKSIGCTACHGENGISLSGLGSKTNSLALTKYLLDPLAFDHSGRMPGFFYMSRKELEAQARIEAVDSEGRMPGMYHNRKKELHDEARRIAAFLVQSRNKDFEAPVPAGDARRGEALVQSRGCLACHTVNPEPAVRIALLGPGAQELKVAQSPWKFIGPFENGGKHETPFPPETKIDLLAAYDSGDGQMLKWQDGAALADGQVHDLYAHRRNSATYLYRTVSADQDLIATVYLGSDDTVSLWVNGGLAYEFLQARGVPEDKDRVLVRFKKGVNHVLLKIGNQGGDYKFYYQLGQSLPPLENTLTAPALKEASGRGCLAPVPAGRAAVFGFSDGERQALKDFIAASQKSPDISPAPVFDFYRAIGNLKCLSCHSMDHFPMNKTLAEAPPPLTDAGLKLRESWLDEVLNHNKRIRPWMKLRMPHFGEAHTAPLVRQFAAAAGSDRSDLPPAVSPVAEHVREGTRLIGKSNDTYGCIACHDFRDQKGAGVRGPDMTEMFQRIRPAWFYRWLDQPARIQPGTSMPNFFDNLPHADARKRMDLIWSVLSLGSGMPQPAGLNDEGSYVLQVKDKPLLIRAGLPESSARSIAVGLGGYLSYCFDAETCRVRYAWFGEFLDVKPVRSGMGSRAAIPLGKRIFTAPDQFPLRIGGDDAPQVSFSGYRLTGDIPEFMYTAGGASVRQRIERLNPGLGLVMHFEVDSGGKPVRFVTGEAPANAAFSSSAGVFENGVLHLSGAAAKKFSVTIAIKEPK